MRVIIDANVAIAAAATRGLCDAVMELCFERHHLIIGEGILAEIGEKLVKKIKVPSAVAADYSELLRHQAELINPEAVDPKTCRDPKDLMVLGLVAPGDAEVIVTGDKDLLVLESFQGAAIMTPRAFWELNQSKP